jgi:hypothetical protein
MGVWDVEKLELEIMADATDVLIVETMMMDDEILKKWEAGHAGH